MMGLSLLGVLFVCIHSFEGDHIRSENSDENQTAEAPLSAEGRVDPMDHRENSLLPALLPVHQDPRKLSVESAISTSILTARVAVRYSGLPAQGAIVHLGDTAIPTDNSGVATIALSDAARDIRSAGVKLRASFQDAAEDRFCKLDELLTGTYVIELAPPPRELADLRGKVRERSSLTTAGCRVALFGSMSGLIGETTTDAQGDFQFGRLSTVAYEELLIVGHDALGAIAALFECSPSHSEAIVLNYEGGSDSLELPSPSEALWFAEECAAACIVYLGFGGVDRSVCLEFLDSAANLEAIRIRQHLAQGERLHFGVKLRGTVGVLVRAGTIARTQEPEYIKQQCTAINGRASAEIHSDDVAVNLQAFTIVGRGVVRNATRAIAVKSLVSPHVELADVWIRPDEFVTLTVTASNGVGSYVMSVRRLSALLTGHLGDTGCMTRRTLICLPQTGVEHDYVILEMAIAPDACFHSGLGQSDLPWSAIRHTGVLIGAAGVSFELSLPPGKISGHLKFLRGGATVEERRLDVLMKPDESHLLL
jgi:hypothetical protein